jgi:hypothetical protein
VILPAIVGPFLPLLLAAPAHVHSGNALRGTEWGSWVESETPITVQAAMKRPRSLSQDAKFILPGSKRRGPIPQSNGAIGTVRAAGFYFAWG